MLFSSGWIVALAVSAIGPYDRLTWFLEVAPALIGAVMAQFLLALAHDRALVGLGAMNERRANQP